MTTALAGLSEASGGGGGDGDGPGGGLDNHLLHQVGRHYNFTPGNFFDELLFSFLPQVKSLVRRLCAAFSLPVPPEARPDYPGHVVPAAGSASGATAAAGSSRQNGAGGDGTTSSGKHKHKGRWAFIRSRLGSSEISTEPL